MNDELMRDLLRDTAEGIEPGDRLDAIRAATAPAGRRTNRAWWVAGGAGLIAASVVTAVVLSTGGAPRSIDLDPADSPSPSQTATDPVPAPTVHPAPSEGAVDAATAVYYVGDTPDGPRLFREFHRVVAPNPFEAAMSVVAQPPLDPDYRNLWPADAIESIGFDGIDVDGVFSIRLSDASYRDLPAGMTAREGQLAVEQVIYTLQAAAGTRAPVQFSFDGNPIDQVLGVPTSEPIVEGPLLETLAHVSISDPSEGLVVDNDEPLTVKGVGNSFEGNIVTRLVAAEGRDVIDPVPAIAGTYEDRLFPYEVAIDISAVPPGDYVVFSQTDDPSGQGRVHTDSRRITIVD